MVHDVQTIRDDLAFMRALAQEGRRAPLLIGHSLLAAGLIYGAASIFAWGVAARVLPLPPIWQGLIWIIATAIFMPYARWRRLNCVSGLPGSTAVTNRAVRAAWQGLSYALLSMLFAAGVIANIMHTAVVFAFLPSAVIAIYGTAWMVAAAMSDMSWLRWVAAACFIAAALIAFTAASPLSFLVFAGAMMAVAAVPGWVLMRSEPSLTV